MTGNSLNVQSAPAERRLYRQSVETVARRIAGEFLLVPLRGRLADLQRVYVLNPVGERLWESLGSGERTAEELLAVVVDAFAVGEEIARRDLAEFLAQLEQEGLLSHRVLRNGEAG